MTLYELTEQLLILAELAEDPDTDPDTLSDTMDAVEGEFEYKAEGYARVLRQLDAQETALRAESDNMKKKADAIRGNAKRIRERLKQAMVATGQNDIRTELFHLYVRKNPMSVVIDNPEDVEEQYLKPQPPTINKTALKADIASGKEYPWCHLEQTTSLIIK